MINQDELQDRVKELIVRIVNKYGSENGGLKIDLELLVATVRVQILKELSEGV